MEVIDQLHRRIYLKSTPKRIVSLVPSQSELLCDLGLEKQIVGITKFCVHPARLKQEKTIVGGTKQVKLDSIQALKPDIILCNKEENTLEMIEQLETVAPVHISDIYTIEDALTLIHNYGVLFSCRQSASIIVETITDELNTFREFISDLPKLKVAYFIWRNPWMVAANGTFINYLLELNHLENVYTDFERYPEIEIQKIIKYNPEYILFSSEPFPFKEMHTKEIRNIVPNSRTLLVDGEYFSWYGSRLIKAFTYF